MNAGARLRVLIVDDEPLAREGLRVLLDGDPEVEIVGECADGEEAVAAIVALSPDILFLDVQMPELDGFQVLRAVPAERWPVVVFVTAYDRYALRAFEFHALDYLLKPFDDERFERTLHRAKAQARRGQIEALSRRLVALVDGAAPAPAGTVVDGAAVVRPDPGGGGRRIAAPGGARAAGRGHINRLAIKTGGRIVFLSVDEIDWIEAADYYVRLHAGGKTHLLRESMRNLERRLDPDRFFRVHRSAIVNLECVREIQPWFRGQHLVILRDGTQLKLSRRRRERLADLLGRPL